MFYETDTTRWWAVVVGMLTFLLATLQLSFFAYPVEAPPLFSVFSYTLFFAQATVLATWMMHYAKIPHETLDKTHLHSSDESANLPAALALLGAWFAFLLIQTVFEATAVGQFADPATSASATLTFQRHTTGRATLIGTGAIGMLYVYLLRPALDCSCGK